jgi:hypothetical protein
MNYQAFTNDNDDDVQGVRGALAADDALSGHGAECSLKSGGPRAERTAAALEAEMLKRRMFFELIDWSQDQRCCTEDERLALSSAFSRITPINQPFKVVCFRGTGGRCFSTTQSAV